MNCLSEPIQRMLLGEYDVKVISGEILEGGLDAQATNWRVASDTGREYVLKARTTKGNAIATIFSAAGISAVLAPLPNLEGSPDVLHAHHWYQLFPFFDGQNGFQRELKRKHWVRLGEALRRIHDFDAELEVSQEVFHVEGIPEFEELFNRALQMTSNPTVENLHQTLQKHAFEIRSALDRVQELARRCWAEQWPLVPCHADLHVGNVLVDSNDDLKIIDWDTARLAPRECDLLFFLGSGITGHGPEAEAAFLEGYGSCKPNTLLLTYYRYARAAEDIVSFSREALDESYPDKTKAEAVRYLEGLFAPRMIVESARTSYENLTI